ncbi:hypothetical protein ACFO4E_15615 [Nocardiopsis mangrovi]|uniref:Uncharacterized protein n=1 Tax=Nocardiopsis mangrovi TaxID=1179818 RepID=A0ABV9DWL8_9ACTN
MKALVKHLLAMGCVLALGLSVPIAPAVAEESPFLPRLNCPGAQTADLGISVASLEPDEDKISVTVSGQVRYDLPVPAGEVVEVDTPLVLTIAPSERHGEDPDSYRTELEDSARRAGTLTIPLQGTASPPARYHFSGRADIDHDVWDPQVGVYHLQTAETLSLPGELECPISPPPQPPEFMIGTAEDIRIARTNTSEAPALAWAAVGGFVVVFGCLLYWREHRQRAKDAPTPR